ncbi:7521_t:CDS:2 [Ambispora gerdemannii]|uniref:7521_t:CDS:1 n=1 Tax=Ambispora gerdemannii TaxID=144530 RepID=A0A9N9FPV0_9GLOM|nr:7521_t:CDS:2 [Ambispora gerdemannii]
MENSSSLPQHSRPPTDHERIHDTLENDFKRMDKMFAKGENSFFGSKPYSRNSDNVFKDLDYIRRKQIELAHQHVALENSQDEELPVIPTEDSAEAFKRNADLFVKKEQDLNNLMGNLNNLMEKLEDLEQSMGQPLKVSKPK